MIRLTRNFGEHVYVSPDAILFVRPSKGNSDQSFISTSYESIIVTESPEEVARKVLEYRLELERYKAAVRVGIEQDNLSGRQMAEGAMDILGELAGLEEQKDE